jgi:nucleoside-diphosphate-sugar epimerase
MIAVYGGKGFIGSQFCSKYESHVMGREDLSPPEGTKNALYLISTIDNYNVLTDPYMDINTNLTHLIKVLEACKDRGIEFTFVSSWFVYGDTELPATETSRCSPKGFYSITKYAAEQLLESYCKTFGLKYKIVRLSNVVGKSDSKVSKKKNALQYLIEEMRENRDINLYYDGNFCRDLIHVDDVVDGLKFVMDKGRDGEIYNLGTGRNYIKFRDSILYLHKKLGSKSRIGSMEPTDFHKIVQVKDIVLNCDKLEELGFKPKYGIREILDRLV